MIGKTISHYRILEELGEGGMGMVYKAEDTKLRRTVALKFLPPRALGSKEDRARFLHEAQAAAALSHANICTIHEIDEYDGQSFIVMELVEGKSLKEKIESGPMRLDEAADVAVQAAEGLREAHAKGIVHRDIKPANIMIKDNGRIKVMDFGLAKAGGRTVLTRVDTTLGTCAYMSPEQARGGVIDHRTDIWSLGIVLYEMVTGQRPFRGDYEQAVIYSIVNEEPEPVTSLRTGVPMELERIIKKCLEKDANNRYQGLADLITDLRQLSACFGTGHARVVTPAKPKKTNKLIYLLYLPIVVVLIILATQILPRYFGTTGEPTPLDDRKMLVVLPFENLGPPEDEYFAAGMTEEITSRIAAVSGIGVISRTSAVQYDRTGKTLKQIGEDLGVGYVLEGTIRWNRQAGGGSSVRVTPQLIRVSDDTHLWAERYDRELEDIFAVQSDIAERIIEQLGVTMLARERKTVEAEPTENLLAYEAYLRGIDQVRRAGSIDEFWRNAETLFHQAVTLDSTFALAYTRLATVHGELYFWGYDKTDERLAKAKAAADRALMIQPDLPEAHMALGNYYYMGFYDFDRALKEFAIAAKNMPNSPELLEAIAYIWRRQGLFGEAIDYLVRAATLDPANFWFFMQIGLTHSIMRNYAEAERYLDRSIELNPDQGAAYFIKSQNAMLWTGDVERAKAILLSTPHQTHHIVVTYLVSLHIYEGDYQSALELAADLPEGIVEWANEINTRDLLLGFTYMLMGAQENARASFESTRILLEAAVQEQPGAGTIRSALGMAYAGLGRRDDAIREGEKGIELDANDAIISGNREWDLATIYILLGERDAAMDHIDHLLSVPSWTSVTFLKICPLLEPLRDDSRFEKILEKYSGDAS